MGNLKHTIVTAVAVVMISSMAIAQTANVSIGKEIDSIKNSAPEMSEVVVNPTIENEEQNIENTEAPVGEVVEVAAAEKEGFVLVNEGALNVRAAANGESEVVDQVECGDKVVILSEEGDFYCVRYGAEGKTGYVIKTAVVDSYDKVKEAAVNNDAYEMGVATVGEGALNVRSEPNTGGDIVDQLSNGEEVVILSSADGWLNVLYGNTYKTGYVIAESVTPKGFISKDQVKEKKKAKLLASAKGKGTITVQSGAVNVRSSASDDAEVITQVYNKDEILIMGKEDGFTKIAFTDGSVIGYVKSEFVYDPTVMSSRSSEKKAEKSSSVKRPQANTETKTETKKASSAPATGSTKGQALVNEAAKYLGTKYVYGGTSPSGFDCSGLVQYACRKQGISVGRSSRDQFGNGVSVSRENLQPGDLVFFKKGGSISHVGIYAGNGQMIHSPQTGKTVCYTSIDTLSRRASYAGARRVAN